jgi:hypothetical protein
MKAPGGFVAAAAVVVVVAVVSGLMVMGSPGEERTRSLDRRRVTDLQGIIAAADLHWTRHAALPAALEDLAAEPGVSLQTADPVTARPYEYRVLDGAGFEVCAVFDAASEEASPRPQRDLLVHGPGRQCFEVEADEVDPPGRNRPNENPGR